MIGQPHPIKELVLVPSSGGRFEISLDGELVFSKRATHTDPKHEQIIEQVRARLGR